MPINHHRILMLVENSYPCDIRVRKEAAALTNAGYSVRVIASRRGTEELFTEINGVKVYRIPKLTLFQKVNKHNSNMFNKKFIRLKSVLGYLLEYSYFTTISFCISLYILIRHGFDVIHTHNPPDTLSILGIFYKIIGKEYVFDHHDLAPELYLTRVSKERNLIYNVLIYFEKLSCKFADVIISTNDSYKEIVKKRHSVNLNKIFIVRNNPIISECSLNNGECVSTSLNKDRKILLFLGSINPQDGIEILLDVLHYLVFKMNRKDFLCNIVGDGDYLELAKQRAKELNITNYVDFKGLILDRDKIKEYLCTADIGVEPAPDNEVNRYSTFIKVMEYMAASLPIVAFDLKETRCSSDGSSILIHPGDIKGFANAISLLLSDTQLREKLGKIGLEKIEKELNWGNASLNLIGAYNSLS